MDIHQGRGNALRILGAYLQRVIGNLPTEIAAVNGGSAQNAIPREASAIVVLDAARENELAVAGCRLAKRSGRPTWADSIRDCRSRWRRLTRPEKVLDAADAKRNIDLLVTMPHGVLAMSPDVPGTGAELDQPGHRLD